MPPGVPTLVSHVRGIQHMRLQCGVWGVNPAEDMSGLPPVHFSAATAENVSGGCPATPPPRVAMATRVRGALACRARVCLFVCLSQHV